MKIGLDIIVLGVIQGLLYGALAIGLVLVYRAQRFVNFAHANIGIVSSVLLGKLVLDGHVPYGLALPVALLAGVAVALLVELTVIRRLFRAPRLVLMVASIFLAQFLLIPRLIRQMNPNQQKLVDVGYPLPFHPSIRVGTLILHGDDVLILLVVPALVAILASFLRFTAYGQAIRAAAENPDAARLAGISVKKMSTLVWGVAGLLSALTAILHAPKDSVFLVGGSGASLLVRALAAGLIAKMTNLPLAFAAGIGIGVVESVTFANQPSGGVVELVVFAIVMAALLVRSRELSRASRDAEAGMNFGAEPPPVPARAARTTTVRRLTSGASLVCLALAVIAPLLPVAGLNTSAKTFLLTLVTAYALVGLSLCLLTGWGGQVSLGQFALVGVGAYAAERLAAHGIQFWAITLAAGLIGAVVAVAVGLPAIRIQGLFLAVTTLAFAVLAQGFLFQQSSVVGDPAGVFLPRPPLLHDERAVYWFGLALVVVSTWLVRNFRQSGPGRMLIAVRDNDKAARSSGISATLARLVAFALAGFIAACAGVVYAYAHQRYVSTNFAPDNSFTMVTMAVIGGLGSIPGALLGAFAVFGIPVLFRGSEASQLIQFLIGGAGGLFVLLFMPRGLAGLVYDVRDSVVRGVVRRLDRLPPPPRIVPPLRELWAVARGRTVVSSP